MLGTLNNKLLFPAFRAKWKRAIINSSSQLKFIKNSEHPIILKDIIKQQYTIFIAV